MHILVTGGAGNVGREVVRYLVTAGHRVRVIDLAEEGGLAGIEYAQCDICDIDALRRQVDGVEGIVHLAAIPSPSRPGAEMFRINALGTYNVFQAAVDCGVRRVAQASSINALGYNYGIKPFPVQALPIDEAHATFTTDPYSYTKETIEGVGRYFWRRCGLPSVAFRLPDVVPGGTPAEESWRAWGASQKLAFEALTARPEREVAATVRDLVARYDAFRRAEGFRGADAILRDHGPYAPDLWWLLCKRYAFWSMVDSRDAARAFELALTSAYEGSHPLFICDAFNATGIPSEDLARVFFPRAARRDGPLPGTTSLVSAQRARELIGFEPVHTLCGPG